MYASVHTMSPFLHRRVLRLLMDLSPYSDRVTFLVHWTLSAVHSAGTRVINQSSKSYGSCHVVPVNFNNDLQVFFSEVRAYQF